MYRLIMVAVVLVIVAFGAGRLSAETHGLLDSPTAPNATFSFTLLDIYNRLNSGATGTQTAFTEPTTGPTVGTMYSLNEIMTKAPSADNTKGATVAQVLTGKTFWGLRTDGTWGTMTGTAYYASVPKTGQTTKSAANDDGDLKKGVAWPSPRFTDNGNGTVTDNLTGLIWLKTANCLGAPTWATALTESNNLTAGYCGLTDNSVAGTWRLPNVRELESLVHSGYYNPTVPNTAGTGQWTQGDPFTNVQSFYYWSSTSYVADVTKAWYVYLSDGAAYYGDKATASYYAWPVKGGQ